MSKWKIRLLTLIIFTVVIGATVFAVLNVEKAKRLEKLTAQNKLQEEQFQKFLDYQAEYKKQIETLRSENIAAMEASKANYEKLLKDQPTLIAQNTTSVTTTTPQTTTKKVTVSKPKSSSSTKTS